VDRLDRVSVYLPAEAALAALDEIAKKEAAEVWFNPGADSPEVLARAKKLGMHVVVACSIVAIGVNPGSLD
jgi:predicted CoA-binding protein